MTVVNKYEIMTRGTSMRWTGMRDCQKHWMDAIPATLADALKVCKSVRNDGYGVRLFENGVEVAI